MNKPRALPTYTAGAGGGGLAVAIVWAVNKYAGPLDPEVAAVVGGSLAAIVAGVGQQVQSWLASRAPAAPKLKTLAQMYARLEERVRELETKP